MVFLYGVCGVLVGFCCGVVIIVVGLLIGLGVVSVFWF